MSQNKIPSIVYCEGQFGRIDGKTANGLVRHSDKYRIAGVVDSTMAGRDAGDVLDECSNGIPIYKDVLSALEGKNRIVTTFIYGMAPLSGRLSKNDRDVLFYAMEKGLTIINGLHEFLTDDDEFLEKAKACGVELIDVRKHKASDLSVFKNNIGKVTCPKIAVLGTDSATGKRTTSVLLTSALKKMGLKAIMIATGQTGMIQGARYGSALDSIPEQFISGEMESAVYEAWEGEHPDIIVIEGQGSLSHPAYLSSCFIIRGSQPDAIVVQHPPKRKTLSDYPDIKMPSIESEIRLLEAFAQAPVIAITLNHENMSDVEVERTAKAYQKQFNIPASDVLKNGCDDLTQKILDVFPNLSTGSAPFQNTPTPHIEPVGVN